MRSSQTAAASPAAVGVAKGMPVVDQMRLRLLLLLLLLGHAAVTTTGSSSSASESTSESASESASSSAVGLGVLAEARQQRGALGFDPRTLRR